MLNPAPLAAQKTDIGRPVLVGLLLTAITVLPGLSFYYGASSLATGTIIAAAAIILSEALGLFGRSPPFNTAFAIIALTSCILIATHLMIGIAMTGQYDITRAILSLLLLTLIAYSARIISYRVTILNHSLIDRIVYAILIIFTFSALLSIADIQPESPRGILAKSVFPFSEPSHYAFSIAPLIIFFCSRTSLPIRVFALLLCAIIAYHLQSLSLVVVVTLSALLTLPLTWLISGLSLAIFMTPFLKIDYFVDRLDFSLHTTNISTLIYIQGLELAQSSIVQTSGWGIGFQQLGVGNINSLTANAIQAILKEDSNIYDGGFTAAKIIAEFGIFGIVAIVFYISLFVKSAVRLRRNALSGGIGSVELLFCAALVGFSVEIFVRGVGYFSGTSLLALSAIFYMCRTLRPTLPNVPN